MDEAISDVESQNLARIFLQRMKKIADKVNVVNEFDKLNPSVQLFVIRGLNAAYDGEEQIERLPYVKYRLIYDEAIKSHIENCERLVRGISAYYHGDAEELLHFVFQKTTNAEVCEAASGGLVVSKNGLDTLKTSLQNGRPYQQIGAIKAIVARANDQPELIEILDANRLHENYLVRLNCIVKLYKIKRLSTDQLAFAVQDEDYRVRSRLVSLIRDVDSGIADDYVTLLEDKKADIVQDVLEIFEKSSTVKVDEVAVVDAIIRVLIIRESGRPDEYFNTEIIANAFQLLFNRNSRLYGETLKNLCDVSFKYKSAVRRRAILVAASLDERGFLAQVNEMAADDPEAAREIANLVTGNFNTNAIANQISGTDPSDVQQNAANQIKLLAQYHESGLQQAKTSFNWAIALSLAGFPFLIFAIYYLVVNGSESPTSIISAVVSGMVEFIAGTLFYLYNQTRKQLTYYHQQMNQIQRFLLANSVAESLDPPAKDNARIELIRTIATADIRDETGIIQKK